MATPDIETVRAGDKVFWQNIEEGVGEPALLVQKFFDTITIQQAGYSVNINYETIPALTKYLNFLYREKVGEAK